MGLTMREKKALTSEMAARYRKETKTGKQAILGGRRRSGSLTAKWLSLS